MIFIKKKGSTFGKKTQNGRSKVLVFSRFMKKARQVAGVLQGKGRACYKKRAKFCSRLFLALCCPVGLVKLAQLQVS